MSIEGALHVCATAAPIPGGTCCIYLRIAACATRYIVIHDLSERGPRGCSHTRLCDPLHHLLSIPLAVLLRGLGGAPSVVPRTSLPFLHFPPWHLRKKFKKKKLKGTKDIEATPTSEARQGKSSARVAFTFLYFSGTSVLTSFSRKPRCLAICSAGPPSVLLGPG